MNEIKKEKIKKINYCCFYDWVGDGFYLVNEEEQVEIIKEFLLIAIKEFKGNFNGTYKPGVTGNRYEAIIKTPGKSLRKALKGSPYLLDSKKSGFFTKEESDKYHEMYYDHIQLNTNQGAIKRLQTEYNISIDKIGLLGLIKDKEYKTKEELIFDLEKHGFTEKEVNIIKRFVITYDNAPYEEKKVVIGDSKNNYMWLGYLYNSLNKNKVEVECNNFGNKIEKSNIRDCFGTYFLTEDNFYIFEDTIDRIFDKYNEFYIQINFSKYEELKIKNGERGIFEHPVYTWDINKLFKEYDNSV